MWKDEMFNTQEGRLAWDVHLRIETGLGLFRNIPKKFEKSFDRGSCLREHQNRAKR